MTTRLTKGERTKQMLDAALSIAEARGWATLTRKMIADRVGCSEPLVTAVLGTMDNLRRDVMRLAVKVRNMAVVAEGLARNDKIARRAPEDLKLEVSQWLASR